jgi:5-methylcytosine-specific restriction protein A
MTDVGTTPRKPLSPRERLKLFESHGGRCVICKQPIRSGERWIDEHVIPLGLGGSNDMGNRGPAHFKCAETKTGDDLPRIAKAKRSKMAALGIKKDGPKIANRGFTPPNKPTREPKPTLPPRRMFTEI